MTVIIKANTGGGGGSGAVDSVNGRTGAVTLSKSDVGLNNVDNTSDLSKPISTATQTALDGKVDENAPITGATKTKITYDSKGLVTGGADATQDDIADGVTNRSYTNTEKTKLAGIAAGATANDTDANLKNRANHTGTQLSSTISDFTEAAQDAVGTALLDTSTLDLTYNDAAGTISGVVLDSPTVAGNTPANLRDRSTHTGTQTASTISDFSEAVDDRVGALLVAGTNITLTYNDAGNSLTIDAAGGGGGSATMYQTTIDFGSTEKSDEVFNIVNASIGASSKIMAFVTWISTLGRDPDEIMADPISISVEPLSGSMNVYASAVEGTVNGKYAINYMIG